ncbi:hypothetical protein [Nonomuraea sp. SBT364]|uniref:hypothetical protein n=1 Tax=Nonomuraea sp. SBT364 TaxID=1580530 RepID=UPI00066D0A12|nr:hypothetical protein [Nonomuraea sp. SBT364]
MTSRPPHRHRHRGQHLYDRAWQPLWILSLTLFVATTVATIREFLPTRKRSGTTLIRGFSDLGGPGAGMAGPARTERLSPARRAPGAGVTLVAAGLCALRRRDLAL